MTDTLREKPHYRFFVDKILNHNDRHYELNKLYDTGEITVYKFRKRTLKAVRRLVKFAYDVENEQPIIYEYFVDAITKSSDLKSYNNIDIIKDRIEAEAKNVKSLDEAYSNYIPMDNFMIYSVNLFKDKVDEITHNGMTLGYRVTNLKWKTITVTASKLKLEDKVLEDHIIIHTNYSAQFFWENIPLDSSDETEFIDISNEDLDKELINREFEKYFKL